jgi:hypothetical protein
MKSFRKFSIRALRGFRNLATLISILAVVLTSTSYSATGMDARNIDADVVCRVRPDATGVCVEAVKFWTVPEGVSPCLLQAHGYLRCAYKIGELER